MKYCKYSSNTEEHPTFENDLNFGDLFNYCPFCGKPLKVRNPIDYLKKKGITLPVEQVKLRKRIILVEHELPKEHKVEKKTRLIRRRK